MEQDKMNSPVMAPLAAKTLDEAQDADPVETVDKVYSAARPPFTPPLPSDRARTNRRDSGEDPPGSHPKSASVINSPRQQRIHPPTYPVNNPAGPSVLGSHRVVSFLRHLSCKGHPGAAAKNLSYTSKFSEMGITSEHGYVDFHTN